MTPTNDTRRCPVCRATAETGHVICEACGADLHAPPTTSHWLSSAALNLTCGGCGKTDLDPQGYCLHCGRRQNRTSDRTELDLTQLGAATDFGKRHKYNQDALAIGRHEDVCVAIVCDGVSSSTHGELAALAAVEAGIVEVLDSLSAQASLTAASQAGVTAGAHAAAEAGAGLDDNPPSCTYVSAVLNNQEIEITWVGDSRAYWVSGDVVQCLTVDDSTVGRLAAHGVPETDERYRSPYATALLAWLGADAPDLKPNRHTFVPEGPGTLIVCSDGLSCYMKDPTDLLPLPEGTPTAIARALTEWARAFGGKDNISVAVANFPPDTDTGAETQTVRLANGGTAG